jgi:AraC-like DNA-binding protein
MILREPPILDRLEDREAFHSRIDSESTLILCRTTQSSVPAMEHKSVSIKAAWGGAETYSFPDRTVLVDDDSYFVVNARRTYGSEIDSREPVRSLAIYFRPGLPEELLGELEAPPAKLLDRIDWKAADATFTENVAPHDQLVTPVLRYIAAVAERGECEDTWYEEHYRFLLARMFEAEKRVEDRVTGLTFLRASHRAETYRRIARARDFILSSFTRELTLAEIASVAHMSVFHFSRVFRRVEGVSPYEMLQRKRAAHAARLLGSTDTTAEEVARLCGLNNRVALYRLCQRHLGANPRGLRAASRHSLH